MLCYVMLCYVMLCYVMLCYVILCYVTLRYVMLRDVTWRDVMLCYVMLCCVMWCYVIFNAEASSISLSLGFKSRLSFPLFSYSVWLSTFAVWTVCLGFPSLLKYSSTSSSTCRCSLSWASCVISAVDVQITKINMAESWVPKLFHTLLRNVVLLDFKRSWKIEMRRD